MEPIADYLMDEKDTSWERALDVVRGTLRVPSPLSTLIRGSFAGIISPRDFTRLLGFPGCNSTALVRAARLQPVKEQPDAAELEAAVEQLGVRPAAVMLSINFVCQSVLDSSPPEKLWTPVLKEMMNNIEVGYHFGLSAESLGPDRGMLVGFSQWAGSAILLGRAPREFSQLLDAGFSSRYKQLEVFGCEPYQAGSLALQQLGFGADIATAAAVSVGDLQTGLVNVDPDVRTWRAARRWVTALSNGENYPSDKASQEAFPELVLPVMAELGQDATPTHLSMLFDSVAEVRKNASRWTWHLPKATYEDSAREVAKYRSTRAQSSARTLTISSR